MAILQGGQSLPISAPTSSTLVPGITAANANYQNQQINNLSKLYTGYYNQDEIYQGQLRNLAAQLQGKWSGMGGVLPQAQQLQNQFGGVLPAGVANFATPEWQGKSLGSSLLQALSSPTNMEAAANNPFSTMAGIQNAYQGAQFSGFHGLGGRGLGHSGAVNALGNALSFQNLKQQSDATNDYMSKLNALYGGFLGNMDTAAATQSGYLNDAFGRASDLIKNGILGTPTKTKAAPTTTTRTTTGAGTPMGTPNSMGGISPNTGMPQYKPTSQYLIGPHGRAPLGADQGMFHMTSGFKVTPRGRQLY